MGEATKIEWCDHTFNPWIGCTKVSPACDHCYAETLMALRYKRVGWGAGQPRKRTSTATWNQVLKWDRAWRARGQRGKVFCASVADVFDAEVPDQWRDFLMVLIEATTNLDWLLLTKRPQVAKKYFLGRELPGNVWLGTTVENQAMADLRIPVLLSIPARIRFLSCEPLLGPVNLQAFRCHNGATVQTHDALSGYSSDTPYGLIRAKIPDRFGRGRLHWVIAGGESGSHARPSHPDWFRLLRDQCQAAGVPFFFKQWGEWLDEQQASASGMAPGPEMFDRFGSPKGPKWHPYEASDRNGGAMIRVGKARAGAKLDGCEWREVP